jgi:hypothetical protein
MALEFIKLVKGDSPVAQVGSYGFFKLGVESGGGGGGSDIVFDRVFGNNTPDVISAVSAEISANNMTSAQVAETYGWNIGDTIDITLTTGEAIQMRIIGFNHDTRTGGGKAGITLEMVNCLSDRYSINDTDTNAGGWKDCLFRNTTLPTIKATLPTEWQDIIVKVDKKSTNGGGANFTEVVTTSDDLFLLSNIEVANDASGVQNGQDEGVVYEYWVNKTQQDRIKTRNDKAYVWWLRSLPLYFLDSGRAVHSDGSFSAPVVTSTRGISFAFCI